MEPENTSTEKEGVQNCPTGDGPGTENERKFRSDVLTVFIYLKGCRVEEVLDLYPGPKKQKQNQPAKSSG